MELRHVRYFIAVAEQRSFSRAAEVLETAQPSLSQQIRQLEDEIGVELFDRERRQIELTAAGTAFLTEARVLMAQLNTAVIRAREAGRGLRGELRIGYTLSAMMSTLPAAIRAYRARYPDVRLSMSALGLDALVNAVRHHDIDAAVFLTQPDLRRFADLDARPIATLAVGGVVPEGHRLAARDSFAIEDIQDETLILYAREIGDIYDVVMTQCRERDFVPARIEEVDRVETILGLVAAGEGISIVPHVYERLGFRGVVYRPLVPAPAPFAMAVARRKDSRSELAASFIRTCEETTREFAFPLT